MYEVFEEPSLISKYFDEYMELIQRHRNTVRNSVFVRYFNINDSVSTFDRETKANMSPHGHGIFYDVYEYMPALDLDGYQNKANHELDNPQNFEAETNIVIFSINKPRFNDLVMFPYKPQQGTEIFRVKEIDTTLSGWEVNKTNFFQLTLEYASVSDISEINTHQHYVYFSNQEKFLKKDRYQDIINNYSKLSDLSNNLTFNERDELFYYEYNGYKIAPLYENNFLYDILAKNYNDYNRYFSYLKRPFGIHNFSSSELIDETNGYDLNNKEIVTLQEGVNKPILKTVDSIPSYTYNADTILFDFIKLLQLEEDLT